jgi:hypothetical protein
MIIKRWTGSDFTIDYPETTVGKIVASGTPSSTTYLRGDGTWNTPVNNYLTGVSGTAGGTITFTRSGLGNLTWDSSHTHSYVAEGGTAFSGTYPATFRIGANNIYSNANITFNGTSNVLAVAGGVTVGGNAVVLTNDSRLSDARTPLTHTHALTDITGADDLKAIEALAGTSGFIKKTAANTYTLDTSTYLTGITKAQIEAQLTGAITTHTHAYEPTITAGTTSQYWRGDKTWQTTPTSNATHTGDVTGATALTIANSAVTLAKMANLAPNLIIGRVTGTTGVPEALTAENVRTIITDASNRFITDTERTTWNAKEPSITKGTTAQYFRGDMSLATFPTSMTPTAHDQAYTTINNVPTGTMLGRNTAGTGATEAITYANLKTYLALNNVTNESKATMFTSPAFTGTPTGITATHVGLGNVTNNAQLPIAGGTMTGILYPQQNTSYTTGQARRIILSTGDPTGGGNGDVWIKYTA